MQLQINMLNYNQPKVLLFIINQYTDKCIFTQQMEYNKQIKMTSFKQMLINEQFTQHYEAKKWGYNLTAKNYFNVKECPKHKQYVLANIQLRNFIPDIPKTQRIRQIEAQIRTLQNQRKLMEMSEQLLLNNECNQQQDKSCIMKMVEQKVKEYNDIIDHLHLTKYKDKRNTQLVNTTTDAAITQRIAKYQLRMLTADIKQKVQISHQIINLYKQYTQKNTPQIVQQESMHHNMHGTQNKQKTLLNKTQPNFKISRGVKNKKNQRKQSFLQIEQASQSSNLSFYGANRKSNKSIQLMKTANRSQQKAQDLIRRIHQQCNTRIVQKSNKKKNRRLQQINSAIDEKVHLQAFIHEKQDQQAQNIHLENQNIISGWLAKRSMKYNRVKNTKILLKYDSNNKAKSMLDGTPNNKLQIKQSALPNQEDVDYWRMCKNQKINLLLKCKK